MADRAGEGRDIVSAGAAATGAALWRALEHGLDRLCGASVNPTRHLGALATLMLWVLLISGAWLYAVFDTSVSGAYQSVARLAAAPHAPGGMLRSLHRYATDAFVLLTLAHVLREAAFGRWRHFRRHTWLTGTAVLPFATVAAIGGFWLNWDALGRFSAAATAEWLDALPLFALPLSRNFLLDEAVSDRLFSLFVFIHVGASLLLLFGLWFHLQRLARPALWPPRALSLSTLASLCALAWVAPVTSQPAGSLAEVPGSIAFDWIVLFIHPLMYASSPAWAWLFALVTLGVLVVLPFTSTAPAPAAAVVAPDQCNGCRRCFDDCPFAAITMTRHPDPRRGRELAVVDARACAACGVCAGACPSSTPFRRATPLTSGVDLPDASVDALRVALDAGLAAQGGAAPRVVFACRYGADTQALAGTDSVVLPLVCAGQLPPSFVEYALRAGAARVWITSCREGGCEFRLGVRWTRARLAGTREPHLRGGVSRDRIRLLAAERGEEALLAAALRAEDEHV
ncbi:MAG TPA: hydrogenase iron-sulfur subunit [Gammaproteobacteria bacterium]|nr:hydrogenase iron-sulfur subunit [Gammaproteobacteria bacterium]